jgi:hypothetical protein
VITKRTQDAAAGYLKHVWIVRVVGGGIDCRYNPELRPGRASIRGLGGCETSLAVCIRRVDA